MGQNVYTQNGLAYFRYEIPLEGHWKLRRSPKSNWTEENPSARISISVCRLLRKAWILIYYRLVWDLIGKRKISVPVTTRNLIFENRSVTWVWSLSSQGEPLECLRKLSDLTFYRWCSSGCWCNLKARYARGYIVDPVCCEHQLV